MDQETNQTKDARYYLGIDWGANRTGLAIADDVMRISTGLEEVETKRVLEKIKQLDVEYDFEGYVIGMPSHGSFDPKKELEDFLVELKKVGKEVVIENEFFSTKVAQVNLSGRNKKGISHADNIEAARLILQGFLDKSVKK